MPAPEDRTTDLDGGFAGAGLDSRTLEPGELFVALKGENVDGRDFIPAVSGRRPLGAGRMLGPGSGSGPALRRSGCRPKPAFLLTPDPSKALACLAATWRSRLDLRVAGVTGTNGKTTTKDFLAAMLRAAGPTLATAGNFNNRLGLPLTLLGLTRAARIRRDRDGRFGRGGHRQAGPPGRSAHGR